MSSTGAADPATGAAEAKAAAAAAHLTGAPANHAATGPCIEIPVNSTLHSVQTSNQKIQQQQHYHGQQQPGLHRLSLEKGVAAATSAAASATCWSSDSGVADVESVGGVPVSDVGMCRQQSQENSMCRRHSQENSSSTASLGSAGRVGPLLTVAAAGDGIAGCEAVTAEQLPPSRFPQHRRTSDHVQATALPAAECPMPGVAVRPRNSLTASAACGPTCAPQGPAAAAPAPAPAATVPGHVVYQQDSSAANVAPHVFARFEVPAAFYATQDEILNDKDIQELLGRVARCCGVSDPHGLVHWHLPAGGAGDRSDPSVTSVGIGTAGAVQAVGVTSRLHGTGRPGEGLLARAAVHSAQHGSSNPSAAAGHEDQLVLPGAAEATRDRGVHALLLGSTPLQWQHGEGSPSGSGLHVHVNADKDGRLSVVISDGDYEPPSPAAAAIAAAAAAGGGGAGGVKAAASYGSTSLVRRGSGGDPSAAGGAAAVESCATDKNMSVRPRSSLRVYGGGQSTSCSKITEIPEGTELAIARGLTEGLATGFLAGGAGAAPLMGGDGGTSGKVKGGQLQLSLRGREAFRRSIELVDEPLLAQQPLANSGVGVGLGGGGAGHGELKLSLKRSGRKSTDVDSAGSTAIAAGLLAGASIAREGTDKKLGLSLRRDGSPHTSRELDSVLAPPMTAAAAGTQHQAAARSSLVMRGSSARQLLSSELEHRSSRDMEGCLGIAAAAARAPEVMSSVVQHTLGNHADMRRTRESNGDHGKMRSSISDSNTIAGSHRVVLSRSVRANSNSSPNVDNDDACSSLLDGASEVAALRGDPMQFAERLKGRMEGHCQLPASEVADGNWSSSKAPPEAAAEQLERYLEEQPKLKKKAGKQKWHATMKL